MGGRVGKKGEKGQLQAQREMRDPQGVRMLETEHPESR